jgi:hypothetical protein
MQNAFNTVAKAKLVSNNKLKTVKLVVAFNVHKTTKINKFGEQVVAYLFPVQAKCAYVSGDLLKSHLKTDLANALAVAQRVARTSNIQFVN